MKSTLLLAMLVASCASASAAERVALVIGNNRYTNFSDNRQLASPVADATDVAAALKSLGYTLATGGPVTNAGKDAIIAATEEFATKARNADAAVFYFSGHGVQVNGDNYLLPSDTPTLSGMSALNNHTVLLRNAVMVALEEADVKTKVIILDCCRDDPFSAQLELALAKVGKNIRTKSVGEISGGYGPGFYLAFATSPGQTAADGNGKRNSPFTAALLKAIPLSAGKDIDFFFRDVKTFLPRDQVSWTNHSITESFVLARDGHNPQLQFMSTAQTVATAAVVEMPPPAPVSPPVIFDLDSLFAGGPYAAFEQRQKGDILRLAQSRLKGQGLYSGEPDGIPGKGTQTALNAWQQNNFGAASGRFDPDTLHGLDLSGIARIQTPPPVARTQVNPRPSTVKPPAARTRPATGDREMSVEEFMRRAKVLEGR